MTRKIRRLRGACHKAASSRGIGVAATDGTRTKIPKGQHQICRLDVRAPRATDSSGVSGDDRQEYGSAMHGRVDTRCCSGWFDRALHRRDRTSRGTACRRESQLREEWMNELCASSPRDRRNSPAVPKTGDSRATSAVAPEVAALLRVSLRSDSQSASGGPRREGNEGHARTPGSIRRNPLRARRNAIRLASRTIEPPREAVSTIA